MLLRAAEGGHSSITDELVEKITGMLLELPNDEIVVLRSSSVALQAKVLEAVEVLDLHYVSKESLFVSRRVGFFQTMRAF